MVEIQLYDECTVRSCGKFVETSLCRFPAKISFLFSKTSSRCLEDVFSVTNFRLMFAIRLPIMSSRRLEDVFKLSLQDVFKTSSRCVCKTSSSRRLQEVFKKTSCNYVLKSSWRRLQNVLEDKNMLPWRHLQDIFEASSVRLRQGECFLGYDKVKLFKSIESIPKRTNFARISTFRFNWFWYYLEKRSISSFANNNGSVNHHVSNI